jgi:hypothetical protein
VDYDGLKEDLRYYCLSHPLGQTIKKIDGIYGQLGDLQAIDGKRAPPRVFPLRYEVRPSYAVWKEFHKLYVIYSSTPLHSTSKYDTYPHHLKD